MPNTTDTSHQNTLDQLLRSAGPSVSPAQLFNGVSDGFWFWALTEGYRVDPRLRPMLPAYPSEDIQYRFTGAAGDDTMREAFGFYQIVNEAARAHRSEYPESVLEFGCGWGRIIRCFLRDVEARNLSGIDCMPMAIDICKSTNSHASFRLVSPLPPSELEAQSLDLIYAYSVFSHLSEGAHVLWLEEFSRLLRPGGLLVATTRPREFILSCAEIRARQEKRDWAQGAVLAFQDTESALQRYDRGEFLYEALGGGDVLDKSFYGETCIPLAYVQRNWSRYFEVRDYLDDRTRCQQNVIIARKS